MSLVFDNIDENLPQTHLFLIGIGGYKHINGGSDPKKQIVDAAENLGQLTSTTSSIEAFYDLSVFFHNNNSWVTQLGSIEILISYAPGNKPISQFEGIDNASLSNMQTSYFRWKERCDKNSNNVALFLFCGHGVEKEDHYLMADDFGAIPQNPWLHAFNFDVTKSGFASCRAKTQLFFVDACREVTKDMLKTLLQIGSIDFPTLNSESPYHFAIKATALGRKAYGKKDQPSYFTQALMDGLKGQVAKKNGNKWIVSTSSICSNFEYLLDLIKPGQSQIQLCQRVIVNTTEITQHSQTPRVILEINCDPDEALLHADLTCRNMESNKELTRHPHPLPWQINVDAGVYELSADFNSNHYENGKAFVLAAPPITQEKIVCHGFKK